jgi:hypothetical protein
MANLTLRQGPPGSPNPEYTYKAAPLTHNELDANFVALDSALSGGHFDSGIVVNGNGIIVDSGDVVINNGNLNIKGGDFNYDPALRFVDNSSGETLRLDSNQNLVLGLTSNVQDARLKVSRVGNQHTLFGSRVSNSGQTTRAELGPAGTTNNTGAGLLATQTTSNFNDWSLTLFAANGTDGYVNSIVIDKEGTVDVLKEISFLDSAHFTQGIDVTGDLNVSGNILNGGNPIAGGTVESVAMSVPAGLSVTGSPITTTGTLALSYDAIGGYSLGIPSDVTQASWDAKLDDAPNNANSYVRTGGAWTILPGAASFTASNGVQLVGSDFSMSGSYTGTLAVTGGISATTTLSAGTDITAGGAITATGDVTAFSDMTIKENIDPIAGALDKVSQIGGYVFNRKGDDSRRYTGVMAQEVKTVLPEAIHGEEGQYSVAYGNMVGLLIEAIKELKAEVEELKKA